jgi:hypothetical protein
VPQSVNVDRAAAVVDLDHAITSPRPIVAVLFLVIASGWAVGLMRNDNPSTQTTTLPILGTSL